MDFQELVANKNIVVPAYQRPFAWENKLIELFIDDLNKCKEKGINYYYGHFILEKSEKEVGDKYEVVDGQQRLSLAALFILYCHKVQKIEVTEKLLRFAENFETVEYDQKLYLHIKAELGPNKLLEEIQGDVESNPDCTLSISRFLSALLVIEGKLKDIESKDLEAYLTKLGQSEVSEHPVKDKTVAVQIFELHNTRGVPLNTIEKVKAKLMQFVYENGGENKEQYVTKVQKHFAKIYAMEQDLKAESFRGDLVLDELLFYHLRMVDDGNSTDFTQPAVGGNMERGQVILNYLENKLQTQGTTSQYVLHLAEKFEKTVEIFSRDLPTLDKEVSHLVGDVLILDKAKSAEFFLLICHNGPAPNAEQLRLWERLLFTYDFHGLFYNRNRTNRDNFPALYRELQDELENWQYFNRESWYKERIDDILQRYVRDGFHDYMNGLQKHVCVPIMNDKDKILQGGYHFFWRDKMRYLLYKYEQHNAVNLEQLRKVIKEGAALEHILPQAWERDWITDTYPSDDERNQFNQYIGQYLNGIGNLLLLSQSGNSKQRNKKPAEKNYEEISGGSYTEHENSKKQWKDPKQWLSLIKSRGNKIIDFMFAYFFASDHEDVTKVLKIAEQFSEFQTSLVSYWHHWRNLYFDLGLLETDTNKTHIRIQTYWQGSDWPNNIQAEFWPDRIAGKSGKEEQQKVQDLVADIMGVGEWRWSVLYPIEKVDNFVKDLKKVITELQEEGYKPLPLPQVL